MLKSLCNCSPQPNPAVLAALDHALQQTTLHVLDEQNYRADKRTHRRRLSLDPALAQQRLQASEALLGRHWIGSPELALATLDYEARLAEQLVCCTLDQSSLYYRLRSSSPKRCSYPNQQADALAAAWLLRQGWSLAELPGEGWLVYSPAGQQWHVLDGRCEYGSNSCAPALLVNAVQQTYATRPKPKTQP